MCLDPAHLNKALKRNDYPLPTMEDVLPHLSRAKVFTVCDVRHGYWHVQLDEESSLLTTFNTPQGRFRWKRLPFGISVASEIFQRKLDEVLEGLLCIVRIVEDIIVGEMVTQQMKLLQKAQASGIKMNPDKLMYRVSAVKCAGYTLTSNGHKPDLEKIRAIKRHGQIRGFGRSSKVSRHGQFLSTIHA